MASVRKERRQVNGKQMRDTAIGHWGGKVEIEKDRELKGILRGIEKGWSKIGAISRVNG